MPKINQEEYEILKTKLNEGYEWVTREMALNQWVRVYKRHPDTGFPGLAFPKANDMFVFVKVGDEPYNIAQLIEEYESEETEVKNMKWFKKKLDDIEVNTTSLQNHDAIWMLNRVHELYDQLDEPEVLSQEWIDENEEQEEMYGSYGVPVHKLQNLLVPKQELPVIPKFVAEWYESEGKRNSWWNWFYKWGRDEGRTELETKAIRWMQEFNEKLFVDMFRYGYEVEEEQKYYVLNNEKYFLLGKDKGHGFIFSTGGNSKLGSVERTSATFELTEQEIKGYDPRYMTFAKPVEELEE